MSDDLNAIVDEIETENALQRVSAVSVFRSLLNQPEYVSISSSDAIIQGASNGFDSFAIALPRPILDAETIQLVSAAIPQCTVNIPDTSCVFWYYKLDAYRGFLPCINNLHYVRLLPSYYKKDQIYQPTSYGYNRLFNSYDELETELQKSCSIDLADFVLNGSNNVNKFKSIYIPNDIEITLDNTTQKFVMKGLNVYTVPTISDWDTTNLYQIGSIVKSGNQLYQAIVPNGQDFLPDIYPNIWKIILPPPAWSPTVNYTMDEIVFYIDRTYLALDDNINQEPNSSPDWIQDGEAFVWNRYLMTGYGDPNILKLQGSLQRPWEPEYVFEIGDIVLYQNISYVATKQTKNVIPTNVAFWQLSTIAAPLIGLEDISSAFDFNYIGIFQIPSQPYSLKPKRLLNTILGFTFNGVFNNSQFSAAYTGNNSATVSVNDVVFLNRIRPIPLYSIKNIPPAPPLQGSLGVFVFNPVNSTGSYEYIADGFCNLVYSQSCHIYASFVAGSTLNSTNNTGLLGTAAMNSSQLGVSFFQQPFSNPLSINGSDIYSISFEIKDDYNEPYFLTNNAKVNLVLKVQYRNKKVLFA